MDALVFFSRIALAVILAASSLLKLRHTAEIRVAAIALGIPRPLGRATGHLLPFIELGLAVMLLIPATAFLASACTLTLLATFTCLSLIALLRHRRVHCHCFGALSQESIGWRSVLRCE